MKYVCRGAKKSLLSKILYSPSYDSNKTIELGLYPQTAYQSSTTYCMLCVLETSGFTTSVGAKQTLSTLVDAKRNASRVKFPLYQHE
jgi:hypothetical protein